MEENEIELELEPVVPEEIDLELTSLEELTIALNEIKDEDIDTSISLESIPELARLVSRSGTVRQLYDIPELSDKFNYVFDSLRYSVDSLAEFDNLMKILKGLHSNTEIDYFKYRLEDHE